MAVIKRMKAPHGAKIHVHRGERYSAPKKSSIIVTTSGGKKMLRKIAKRKAGPAFSIQGQGGTGIIKGSQWRITREPDQFTIKRPPKKPKVRYV